MPPPATGGLEEERKRRRLAYDSVRHPEATEEAAQLDTAASARPARAASQSSSTSGPWAAASAGLVIPETPLEGHTRQASSSRDRRGADGRAPQEAPFTIAELALPKMPEGFLAPRSVPEDTGVAKREKRPASEEVPAHLESLRREKEARRAERAERKGGRHSLARGRLLPKPPPFPQPEAPVPTSRLPQRKEVAFTLRFNSLLEPQQHVLRQGEEKVVRIGRSKENEVCVPLPGVSWLHAELKLMPSTSSGPVLCVLDLSTNATGLKTPGSGLDPLPKGKLTPVQDGSLIIFPMKVKGNDPQGRNRMCLRVDFDPIPVIKEPPVEEKKRVQSTDMPAPKKSHRVDVRVQGKKKQGLDGRGSLDVRMLSETKFQKMMQAWSAHHRLPEGQTRFFLGNRELRPEESPSMVGWAPNRGTLIVEARIKQQEERKPGSAEDGASAVDSSAPPPLPFLTPGWAAEDDGSPDLIACADEPLAASAARYERERAAKLLRDALDHDEESDHLSGPSPDSED